MTELLRSRKVFVASLHRCGTQSVHRLLCDLGLKSIHWPKFYDGIDLEEEIRGREADRWHVSYSLNKVLYEHDAVSDVPICGIYDVLARRFPSSQFIVLHRPAEDWIRSVRRHIGRRDFDPYEKVVYTRYLHDLPQKISDVSDGSLKAVMEQHAAEVYDFFRGTGQLLMTDLGSPSVGRDICEFLGRVPIPFMKVDYQPT
ncbi:conserved hypothetical protein [Methylobacterium sp. 4-46]|uniref:sulfotransferase n=1 Tax=unclassified Methylobacterium TaxID=2615210 RepID=UPI000152CAD0|nr:MULTISPECIES: sulfotransferase [Methylobacterium]ACA18356.1 conserved hypothetical protein [Methylobacterium sp. 4-46]WFT77653.1 sulfotransferase [Methylobacterium nodulans]